MINIFKSSAFRLLAAPILNFGINILHMLWLPNGKIRDVCSIELMITVSIFVAAILNPGRFLSMAALYLGPLENDRINIYFFVVHPLYWAISLVNFIMHKIMVLELQIAVDNDLIVQIDDAVDYIEWLRDRGLHSNNLAQEVQRAELLNVLFNRDYSDYVIQGFLELCDQGYTDLVAPKKLMATQFLLNRAYEQQQEDRAEYNQEILGGILNLQP